jgi:hypothetical protein
LWGVIMCELKNLKNEEDRTRVVLKHNKKNVYLYYNALCKKHIKVFNGLQHLN